MYNVIYADPPWSYKNYNYDLTKTGSRAKRGVVKEYPTMSIEDIKSLKLTSIMAEDCYLFLWATAPLLPEAIDVVKAWGFKYNTVAFTWIKTNKISKTLFWGMGNSTRSNAEFVLLGTNGRLNRLTGGVHSVILEPVGKHSAKPPCVRDKIVELYGDIPRIELFARESAQGWDVLGNEIDGKDIRDILI